MKKRLAHLADVHITRNPLRHEEYQRVFRRASLQLEADQPDVIVIAGDLFHNFIAASNEATLLAGSWLLALSAIAPVIITRGNHDYDNYRPERVDSVQTVVDLLATDRVRYLNRTGFYVDQNLIWVVWHHGDDRSPWNVLKEARKKGYPEGFYADDIEPLLIENGDPDGVRAAGYTFIDIFHDPLTGAKACNGEVFREGSYLRQSDLQGDYALLGDIHLRQYFTRPGEKLPFAAYAGSLVQQHFGEPDTGHGYLLLDLDTGVFTERDVPNDVAYYTVFVDEGTDYDQLALKLPTQVAKTPFVRVYWRDNSLQHTQLNKTKLRKYLKDTLGATVQFDPHPVDQREAGGGRTGSELDQLDLSDADVQRRMLVEYLQGNNIPEAQIASLVELDGQVSERLRVAEASEGEDTGPLIAQHHGDVRLLNLTLDNFQSTDKLSLDFENNPGLWQISGPNEVGKSTVAMGLMYLHWGNTLGTMVIKNGEVKSRAEKNGDNRFINNKRDEDYCQLSGDYDVGGTLLRATRRTERKWKRAKAGEPREISTCSTKYKLELLTADRQVDADVSVDKRRRTEQLAQQAFGSLDDFLRQCFFSADTMSGLLSVDRSVFIDTLLRDLRLDQYDRKLKTFREWKSDVGKRTTRISVVPAVEEAKLADLEASHAAAAARLEDVKKEHAEAGSSIKREQTTRDRLQEEFQPVPPEVAGVEEPALRQAVHRAVEAVHLHGTKEQDLARRCEELPASYDEARFQHLRTEVEASQGWVRERSLAIEGLGNQVDGHTNNIVHLEGMLKLSQQKGEAVKVRLGQDLTRLGAEVQRRDMEIATLEQSTVCPTCQQLKTPGAVAAIQADVQRRRQERDLYAQQQDQQYRAAHDQELAGYRQEYVAHKAAIQPHVSGRETLVAQQEAIRQEITTRQLAYAQMGEELSALDQQRQQVERRRELTLSGESFPVIRRELEFAVVQARERLDTFQKSEKVRLHNLNLREQIARLDERVVALTATQRTLAAELLRLEQVTLPGAERDAQAIRELLARYAEQQQREQMWAIYEKCMSREGLPMLLLRRGLGSINEQMADLLEGLCFSIYLDEDLEFRMSDHRREGVDQHILQGSGMERTFASLVLRLGLRRLNHRARWNILVMDELLGKLDGESTVRYADLLRTAAGSIEHVMVIEHHGEGVLHPDHLLRVHAENGVSRYQMSIN